MSEETVFWDLNYAIKYKSLGTEEIQTKVLITMAAMGIVYLMQKKESASRKVNKNQRRHISLHCAILVSF